MLFRPLFETLTLISRRCNCSLQNGVEKANVALANALDAARTKLSQGEAMRENRRWEAAIELFTAGLAVRGTHDEDLTDSLKAALAAVAAEELLRGE